MACREPWRAGRRRVGGRHRHGAWCGGSWPGLTQPPLIADPRALARFPSSSADRRHRRPGVGHPGDRPPPAVADRITRPVRRRRRRRRRRLRPTSGDPLASAHAVAVIFDFGGVILTSPFDAFARYEADNGLPTGLLRRLNTTDPDTNAWARLERNEVDPRRVRRAVRSRGGGRPATGSTARAVLGMLVGQLRPPVVEVLRRCPRPASRPPCSPTTSSPTRIRPPTAAGPRAELPGEQPDGRRPPPLRRDRRVVRAGVRKPDPATTGSCSTRWASSPRSRVPRRPGHQPQARPRPWA